MGKEVDYGGSIQNYEEDDKLLDAGDLQGVVKEEKPRYPVWRILLITLGMFGMEFPWSFEYTFYTPTLRELGVSSWVASYAWIFSPVAAILFVPLFGSLSDKVNTAIGRRSPFIILTTIISCLAMIAIPCVVPIGQAIVTTSNNLAVVLVVISYLILDFSNKIFEEMARALVVSVLPGSQIALGNALYVAVSGLGSAAGYIFGYIHLDEFAMYAIGICVFVPCAVISLAAARERRYVPTLEEKLEAEAHPKGLRNLIRTLRSFPIIFYFLMFTQLIAWAGLWPVWTFVSDWMGETIFGGDPTAPEGSVAYDDYTDGVHAGSLANGIMALVNVSFSLIVTPLARRVGMKPIYLISHLISGTALALCYWVQGEWVAVSLISCGGLVWSVNGTFPYVIICNYIKGKDRGLAVGLIYVTSIVSQIVVAIGFGFIISLTDNDIAVTLLMGGLCLLIAGGLSMFIPMKQPDEDTDAKLA